MGREEIERERKGERGEEAERGEAATIVRGAEAVNKAIPLPECHVNGLISGPIASGLVCSSLV